MPAVADSSSVAALQKEHLSLIPQIVLFTRPNSLIYDEHVIDLYPRISAHY